MEIVNAPRHGLAPRGVGGWVLLWKGKEIGGNYLESLKDYWKSLRTNGNYRKSLEI